MFSTSREAKEYLVSSIVLEAERQKVSLTEVERQMLYYSEVDWSPANTAAVSDEFDRDYDTPAFERKIADLIRSLRAHSHSSNRGAYNSRWSEAYLMIASEDHYLAVMIKAAGAAARPPWDRLKLVGTALAIVFALVAMLYLTDGR